MVFGRRRSHAIARQRVFLVAHSATGLPQQIARVDFAFIIFGGLVIFDRLVIFGWFMLARLCCKLAFGFQPSRATKLCDMLEQFYFQSFIGRENVSQPCFRGFRKRRLIASLFSLATHPKTCRSESVFSNESAVL